MEPWQQAAGPTVFQPFAADSDYYPAHQQVMLNFRVADMDAMIEQLGANGVKLDDKRMDEDYGRFAWAYDPEGNKIELCSRWASIARKACAAYLLKALRQYTRQQIQ
jgi:predicted enzyme related to lactoylglutathione lyase